MMNPMCPNCEDEELIFQDDSFDHEFGTEIIRFYYCENCDYQIDAGELRELYAEERMEGKGDKNG